MMESWYAWLLLQWKTFLSPRRKNCIRIYVYERLALYLELNIPDFVRIHESTVLK